MGRYTQEEETLIVKTAKELTATIEAEEIELSKLKSQKYKEKPAPPVRKTAQHPPVIQPDYPHVPKTTYSFTDHLKWYFNENMAVALLLLIFLSLIFVILVVSSYFKKVQELNNQLANDPAYLSARAEAERVATEKQAKANAEFQAEQKRLDLEYEEQKSHYENVIIPEYNNALEKWSINQNIKIKVIESEIEINKEALSSLYDETRIISSTYRELWILVWLYNDMNTSDHDIRYATELLDRDRQRLATQEAGEMAANAVGRMTETMEMGFDAIYDAIEQGNELQEDTISILSKARRDMNIGNATAARQRHKTNDYLDELLKKRKKK